jgi:hypothetical protein
MMSNIPAETVDTILGGALTIAQPANGYRFSIDSILLARFADIRPRDRVLELGAGSGVISIAIAATRHPRAVIALELQPALVELIARNAALNGCLHLTALRADLRRRTISTLVSGSTCAAARFPRSSPAPSTPSSPTRPIAPLPPAASALTLRAAPPATRVPPPSRPLSALPAAIAKKGAAPLSFLQPPAPPS